MSEIIRSLKNYKSLPAKVAARLGEEVRSGMVYNSAIGEFTTTLYSVKDSEYVVVEIHDALFDTKSFTMFANLTSFESLQRAIKNAPKYHKNRAYKGWSKNLKLEDVKDFSVTMGAIEYSKILQQYYASDPIENLNPVPTPGDFLPAEVLDPETGDEIVIRGKNGIVYEGAYLDGDDKSVLARVWDREVGTNYTARWSWKYVVEINGQTPAVASV